MRTVILIFLIKNNGPCLRQGPLFFLFMAAVLMMIGSAASLSADDFSFNTFYSDDVGDVTTFLVEELVELEPIRPEEVAGVENPYAAIARTNTRSIHFNTHLTRYISVLWRVETNSLRSANEIQYEVVDRDGIPGRLSHVDDPTSYMTATIEPVERRTPSSTQKRVLIEGSVFLNLDITHVKYAGAHEGTIIITMNQL